MPDAQRDLPEDFRDFDHVNHGHFDLSWMLLSELKGLAMVLGNLAKDTEHLSMVIAKLETIGSQRFLPNHFVRFVFGSTNYSF